MQILKVPEIVVRRLGLWHFVVGFRLSCTVLSINSAISTLALTSMNDVGKLDGVLDEKDGNVVSDNVPVSLVGVKLEREAAHIANRVGGPARAQDGGEAGKDGRGAACIVEHAGARELGDRFVQLEVAVGAGSAGMDDSFGDALVVD